MSLQLVVSPRPSPSGEVLLRHQCKSGQGRWSNSSKLMSTGKLWALAADGTVGLGMPQLQFVGGGDFASALSEAAKG